MDWKEDYKRKIVSAEEMAKQVKSGDFIMLGLGLGCPTPRIIQAILDRAGELKDVAICDAVPVYPSKLLSPDFMKTINGHINHVSGFFSPGGRAQGQPGLSPYFPVSSSDCAEKVAPVADVLICQVTPPNKRGYVNLGLTNFYHMDLIRTGKEIGKQRLAIGEVNDQMPVVFGNNWMHISEFDLFVETSMKIPSITRSAPGEKAETIGRYVLELINDGDTIQMGIGAIPEAVVAGLEGKHDIGVLTEMFPVGLDDLVAKRIVTNNKKPFHKGKTIATFCMADQSLYEFIEESPDCEFHPASYTNNPTFIAQHPNLIAINMALLVDFTGQICSEGLGFRQISGTGGQLDFMMGANYSKGGKGITLLTASREMKDGSLVSSIVPDFPPGTPVTVPRILADYVITEYGIAHLWHKTTSQRAEALINIAHPDLRGELRNSMKKHFYMR
ncbi:MAG: acetyl-CoA hydrolase/transferase C-terminal domain-containing protein [Syntrophaceae bacterium]